VAGPTPTLGERLAHKETNMRKTLTALIMAAALSTVPASAAFATTPPDDPNDVEAIDNPIDENDDEGFDDWGLLGLLGLVGLAGLKRRDDRVVAVRDDHVARR
jgi:MYXO-CTERM domain-containing protein